MPDEISANHRRARTLVVVEVVLVTLLLGLIGFFLLSWISFVVALVIVSAAAFAASRQATRTVLRRVGGSPADPVRHARLHNLVEGLSAAAGVPKPHLLVIDDPAPNAMACGRSARTAALVVTQGLLDKLSRIELEGVLAHELSHIRSLDILPATMAAVFAAPLGPKVVELVVNPEREANADAHGVSITRYPPGLLAGLEKIDRDPVELVPRSRTIAHLWLRAPKTVGAATQPFDERIEALREL